VLIARVPFLVGLAGEGEEDVVEVGRVDRQLADFDGCVLEPVQQRPQRLDAAVAGDLEGERLVVAHRLPEHAGGRLQPVRVGEPEADVAAGDAALELVRGALGDQPAVVEQRDPVGELVGLLEVLRGEEDGGPAGHQLADELPHGAAAARVQAGGGLVQEDDPRVADQGHRQVEPPLHPAGVGAGRLPAGVGQVELVEQLGRAPPAPAPAQVAQVGHQGQVLGAGEQLVHRGELAGDPDRGTHRVRVPGHVMAADAHLAAVGADQGRQDVHRGGLAGAVGAEQREDRPLGNVQVDAVQHELVAERLAQPGRPDRRPRSGGGRGHAPSSRLRWPRWPRPLLRAAR
jgi:hypothetical protein